jgi:hypothetical protein
MKLCNANHFAVSKLTLMCHSCETGSCMRPRCEDVVAESAYSPIHS